MSDDGGRSLDGPDTLRGAVLLLLVGLAVTGYGGYEYTQQSAALSSAVEVDAELVETGVETVSSGSSGVDHRPTTRFTYEYGGQSYTSTRVFPTDISRTYDTESAARSVLDGYESGATVTAYVPPERPGDGFLRHESTDAPLLTVGIGAFLLLGGGVSTLRNYRTR